MSPDELQDPDLRWQAFWNSVADISAKAARKTGGTAELQEMVQRHYDAFCWRRYWAKRFQSFLLAMARLSVAQTLPVREQLDENVEVFPWTRDNAKDLFDMLPVNFDLLLSSSERIRAFDLCIARRFVSWIAHLEQEASTLAPVSFLEMFVCLF